MAQFLLKALTCGAIFIDNVITIFFLILAVK